MSRYFFSLFKQHGSTMGRNGSKKPFSPIRDDAKPTPPPPVHISSPRRPRKVTIMSPPSPVVKSPLSSQQLRETADDANEILPRLWLGNEYASRDEVFLSKNNITVIINATESVKFGGGTLIKHHMRIKLDDSLKQKDFDIMTNMLPYAVQYLNYMLNTEKRSVLVHCHAGMQRSAAIVAGYLMQYRNMTYKNSLRYIISRRPIAFLNGRSINFEESMLNFFKNIVHFNLQKYCMVSPPPPGYTARLHSAKSS